MAEVSDDDCFFIVIAAIAAYSRGAHGLLEYGFELSPSAQIFGWSVRYQPYGSSSQPRQVCIGYADLIFVQPLTRGEVRGPATYSERLLVVMSIRYLRASFVSRSRSPLLQLQRLDADRQTLKIWLSKRPWVSLDYRDCVYSRA